MPLQSKSKTNFGLEALKKCLEFPSISTDPSYKNDVLNCATYIQKYIKDIEGSDVTLHETNGHPIVLAKFLYDASKPTVLIYGHYDVQPVDPIELWESPPFSPTVRDGYLYARGSSDNKGQFFCHLESIRQLILEDKTLPVNVIFIIEGEEEIGSPNLLPFITEHKEHLTSTLALVSDTPMFDKNNPSLCTSLRGLVYFKIHCETGLNDCHSGQHGGLAPNAIHVLNSLLSSLKDESNKLLVPTIYDSVHPIDDAQRKTLETYNFDAKTYQKTCDFHGTIHHPEHHPYECLWYQPSCDIHGIHGGHTGDGSKTVIPKEASADFSLRIVANQHVEDVEAAVIQYLEQQCPSYAKIKITCHHSAEPVHINADTIGIQAASQAIQSVYNKKPLLHGEGGSIPIIAAFKDVLNLDTVLMGLNFPDDCIHAPNERFYLENFYNGVSVSKLFLKNLASLYGV